MLTLTDAIRNARCDAIVDPLDGGTGHGYFEIRSGSRPATPGDTATGTLLATVVLADPAFGAASAGEATVVDPDSVTAVCTGTATWFRAFDCDDVAHFDGEVGATGSGADLELDAVSITTGSSVDVTGGTVLDPQGEV